jgi:hypothetical protein
MDFHFLGADVPLTKTFTAAAGTIEKSPYPMVRDFVSYKESADSIEELYDLIASHAEVGHCLLKGLLSKEIRHESRAGLTDPNAATCWLVLDIDGVEDKTVEAILAQCRLASGASLDAFDHIVQYSSSMGVVPDARTSAHVFFLLSAPVGAGLIKLWMQQLNLTHFRAQISLTKTNAALSWPLDITVNQSDKLIYIAPPILTGCSSSLTFPRIQLIKAAERRLPAAALTINAAQIGKEKHDTLNTLRADLGLPRLRDYQTKAKHGVQYLSKPGEAVISGLRHDRGFVYLNLNGGNSWGYYHPEGNPEFIYNFKGEPTYRTEELLPDYWRDVSGQQADPDDDRQYLVGRNFATGRLFNAIYTPASRDLELGPASSVDQLKHFLRQYGQPMPDTIPDWDVVYDPRDLERVRADRFKLNLFAPSSYHFTPKKVIRAVPPTIRKLIDSAVGPGAVGQHFLNWLAYIIQNRDKTKTGWLLHGVPGTGKGLLVNKVIGPLLGMSNLSITNMTLLNSQFNGFIFDKLLVFIDEVRFSALKNGDEVMELVKSFITEDDLPCRRMHQEALMARNYANFILASNNADPLPIAPDDRRFNVGAYQAQKLEIAADEVQALEAEAHDFFHFLVDYAVDERAAHTPFQSADRDQLISVSQTSAEDVAAHVIRGDIEFLLDLMPQHAMTPAEVAYDALLKNIIMDHEHYDKLTRDELFIIFDYAVGDMPKSPHKFTSYLKHRRIYQLRIRRGDTLYQGIPVQWDKPFAWFQEQRIILANKAKPQSVVPIAKAKLEK